MRAAIRAVTTTVCLLGAGHTALAQTGFIQQRGKLTASDSADLDRFGFVAMDGNTAIVGAPQALVQGSTSGAAYIFVRQPGGRWAEIASLTASDASFDDGFGAAVAISGDTAIVGSAAKEQNTGAAYIFSRHHGGENAWGEVTKLSTLDVLDLGDNFGASVSIDRDTAIVGAPFDDDRDTNAGAVYVFERHHRGHVAWSQTKKLFASDAIRGSLFGIVLALDGDVAVVRGEIDDPNFDFVPAPDSSAAYILSRNHNGPNAWGETARVTASDAFFGDNFGESLAIRGNTLIVGASFAEGNRGRPEEALLGNSGAAYIFARDHHSPAVWREVVKLTALDAGENDEFGSSVSLDGDIAVIGAANDDDTNGLAPRSGAAYVFSRHHAGPNAWGQVAKLKASDAEAGDQFGRRVAIDRTRVLIGAPGIHALPGAVYVCNLNRLSAIVGACRRSIPIVNDLVTTKDFTESSATRRTVTMTGTFTNTGTVPIEELFFEVTSISEGSTLRNADGRPGGVGATLTPDIDDGILSPGESVVVDFVIRRIANEPIEFLVNVRGVANP